MAKARNAAEIARDRHEIARLYLKGELQVDIGHRLGMSQATVSRDLKALHSLWLEAAVANYDKRISLELAKIDNLEVEYWEAWHRSMQVKESSTAKIVTDASGERNEASTKQEQQIGTESFLAGVRWCIDRRLKLFGLDAPLKIDWRQTLPDGLDGDEVQQQFLDILNMAAQEDATTDD